MVLQIRPQTLPSTTFLTNICLSSYCPKLCPGLLTVTLNELRPQTMPCQTTSMAQEELESSYNRLKHGILECVCLKQETFIKAADYLQLFC